MLSLWVSLAVYPKYSQAMLVFILMVIVEEHAVIWERSRIKHSCEAKIEGSFKTYKGVLYTVALVGFITNDAL